MSKSKLVQEIASATGLQEKPVGDVIDALFKHIRSQVFLGQRVRIADFGTFSAKAHKERSGRNPQTGKLITIPKTTRSKFSPATSFKALFRMESL